MESLHLRRGVAALGAVSGCLYLALLIGYARGQAVNRQSLYGRDTTQSVYVRDSAVAVEKFALAERMEHLKEWDKSADVYMEILRSYADRVVPSQVDKENRIYQYTSVTPAVQERLAKWPAEGLEVYRLRYEGEAAALLESSDDPETLHRVFSVYFVTDSARRAAIRLMDVYVERAEFAAAAWTGERLLAWHPSLDKQRAMVLFRTALAYHLAGLPEPAREHLQSLRTGFPDAVGTVRGTDVMLADALAQELAATGSRPKDASAESWPMAFGSPDRSRIPMVHGFGGARLFSIELDRPSTRRANNPQIREIEAMNQSHMDLGLMTGIFPVVDRGELYFQDNSQIYAVSLESGYPLPGWAEYYSGAGEGRYSIPAWPNPRAHQQTLTVTENAVLAVMGQADVIGAQPNGPYGRRDTRLVCLERSNGQPRWVVQPRQFPESAANLRNITLSGSPLVAGDTVYVQGRGGSGIQFEDAYVLAFNLANGALKWACYIASANSESPLNGSANAILEQNVSHLAYSSGRLYCLTNLGAAAAIDAYDGTIVWLNLYPREAFEQGRNAAIMMFQRRRAIAETSSGVAKPWMANPVIVTQGKVFVLPSDGRFVHIYDAGSGVELKRLRLSDLGNSKALLGVVDDRMVLTSDRQVFCVNWPAYEPVEDQSKVMDMLFWSAALRKSGMPDDSIRGRGFVTAEHVVIPTAWQLQQLSLRTGSLVSTYPSGPQSTWREDEGPGNVLVTQDRVVVAGPVGGRMRVAVYTDLRLAMAKLDAAVAAAPDDPAPRLRYAEIMFVAGNTDTAIAKLDEAIGIALGGARDAVARDRIFNTSMSFAQKLADADQIEPVAGLFDRAARAANNPAQQVDYRLKRAGFERSRRRPAEEVRLYQEILLDDSMRTVTVSSAEGEPLQAAAMARRGIDASIQRFGAEVFAPFEQAATQAFDAASAAGSPAPFQTLAQSYPNSTIAPRALVAAAKIYEAANDPRRATQVLRQVYFGYPKYSDRTAVIEMMARSYLMMPNRVDVAMARLLQGAKLPGNPRLTQSLTLPDGRKLENMTFADAAAALRPFSAAGQSRDLPDIGLPTVSPDRPGKLEAFKPEIESRIVPEVAAILAPLPGFARHDLVVTFTPGKGLRVFSFNTTQPALTCEAINWQPAGIAWVGENLLVWGPTEISLLSGTTGQQLWQASPQRIPTTELVQAMPKRDEAPAAADAAVGGIVINGPQGEVVARQRIVIRNGQQLIIQGNGRIINGQFVNGLVANGQLGLPALQVPPREGNEVIYQVRPVSDQVIFSTTHGRLVSLDLETGAVGWQSMVGDRAPGDLQATDDFIALRSSDDTGGNIQIAVLDTYSGQVLTKRDFGVDAGDQLLPVNMRLAPDGHLVVLMPDRICGKDLFEPGGLDRFTYEAQSRTAQQQLWFIASTAPDAIQISGDKIFVLADNDTAIRVHSLVDGSPVRFGQGGSVLPTGAPAGNPGRTTMRVVGANVYVASAREVHAYSLETMAHWSCPLGWRTAVNLRDLFASQGHLVVLSEPAPVSRPRARARAAPAEAPPTILQLQAFSRAPNSKGAESGNWEHDVPLTDASSITQWQPMNGGFCYLSGDQRLHWRAGAAAR